MAPLPLALPSALPSALPCPACTPPAPQQQSLGQVSLVESLKHVLALQDVGAAGLAVSQGGQAGCRPRGLGHVAGCQPSAEARGRLSARGWGTGHTCSASRHYTALPPLASPPPPPPPQLSTGKRRTQAIAPVMDPTSMKRKSTRQGLGEATQPPTCKKRPATAPQRPLHNSPTTHLNEAEEHQAGVQRRLQLLLAAASCRAAAAACVLDPAAHHAIDVFGKKLCGLVGALQSKRQAGRRVGGRCEPAEKTRPQ